MPFEFLGYGILVIGVSNGGEFEDSQKFQTSERQRLELRKRDLERGWREVEGARMRVRGFTEGVGRRMRAKRGVGGGGCEHGKLLPGKIRRSTWRKEGWRADQEGGGEKEGVDNNQEGG